MDKIDYARKAYDLVKPISDAGETITYSEVAKAIGYPYAIWHRHFGDVLEIVMIQDPTVASCIVEKATGKPSPKFFAWADRTGRKVVRSVKVA